MACKGCQKRRKKIKNWVQKRKDAQTNRMSTIKFLPGDRVQSSATANKKAEA